MRKHFALLLSICSTLFCSCTTNESDVSTRQPRTISISIEEHQYDEVKNNMVRYPDIFSIDKETYYLYFFSRTCSHCISIKDFIIDVALKRDDIYFIESSSDVVFVEDVKTTIGTKDISEFGILGFPSLVKIEKGVVIKNIAGIVPIKKELIN